MSVNCFPNETKLDIRLLTLDPDEKFLDWIPTVDLRPLEVLNNLQFTRMPIYQERILCAQKQPYQGIYIIVSKVREREGKPYVGCNALVLLKVKN